VSAARPLPRRVTRPMAALTLALSAATLVACSGGAEPSSAPSAPGTAGASSSAGSSAGPSSTGTAPQAPSSTVLEAGETDFAIELSQTDLEAGTYTIEVANKGFSAHDLVVEDAAGAEVAASEVISPGGSATVEVELQPGQYVFYCSIDNHRAMGMELAVTVV
jgi:uncharacterized cupredoxin-like copper-binding protein